MGMNAIKRVAGLAAVAALGLMIGGALNALVPVALAQEGEGSKQPYTMPEYNSYQACATDKNPASQVKCFDDFFAKYPNSALLIYAYPIDYQAYSQLKNWQKVIEFADKLVGLGDKAGPNEKYGALYARAYAYNMLNSNDPALAKAEMDACAAGLALIPELKKPEQIDEKTFDQQKKQAGIYLNGTCAQAAMVQKDYANAVKYYKAVLELSPDEAITSYRLGLAYLAMTPPQTMDGFWAIARAITSKNTTQQQVTQLKTYLRQRIVVYQGGTVCDNLTDAELNELLQLAASSPERPASYTLVTSDQLTAARTGMTIASVISDLKAGGDKAKVTWLAACGLEFPEVPAKVIEVTPGATDSDPIDFKVAFVTSEEEFNAATTADMDVKVVGQPEASRVEKDSAFHFTATLVGYDPAPNFMIHWDKGKVKADDIPAEKAAPKKPVRRPTRKPGRRSN
jgi:tetratricopeptide (TPR) repeat protein